MGHEELSFWNCKYHAMEEGSASGRLELFFVGADFMMC